MIGGSNTFSGIPDVVKNLLIINGLMLFATIVAYGYDYDLAGLLGLHHWSSDLFKPHQLITYLFMHGGISHLFFNMFALFMFGRVLEQSWGAKKFLIFYILTGVGAGIIQLIVTEIRIQMLIPEVGQEGYRMILEEGLAIREMGKNYVDQAAAEINNLVNLSTVGASGAVYGILFAFGYLYPNIRLMLIFPPIPIRAKYMVTILIALELYLGIANNPNDNVAHFAHLGGVLFGFLLLKVWNVKSNNFM